MKLTETEVRAPETKQQGWKRNDAFRDTIPALSVYCKRSFNGKVEPPFISYKKGKPLFMVPCNQQGNQVRICNKSFGDFIGTILANKGEINYHAA